MASVSIARPNPDEEGQGDENKTQNYNDLTTRNTDISVLKTNNLLQGLKFLRKKFNFQNPKD